MSQILSGLITRDLVAAKPLIYLAQASKVAYFFLKILKSAVLLSTK